MENTQSSAIYYYIPTTQARITPNSNGESILLPSATLGTVANSNDTQSLLPSGQLTQDNNSADDAIENTSSSGIANEPLSLTITLPSEFAFRANEVSVVKSTLGETFRVYDLPALDHNCALFGIYGRRITREEVIQQLLTNTNSRVRELMAMDMLSLIGSEDNLPRQIRQNNRLRNLFDRLREYSQGTGEDAAREAVLSQLQDRSIFEDYVRHFVGGRISESPRSPYHMLTYVRGTETEPGTTGALAAIAELNNISLKIYQEFEQTDGTKLLSRVFSYHASSTAPVISLLHTSQNPESRIPNHFQLLIVESNGIPIQEDVDEWEKIMPDSQFLNATKNMLLMKAAQEGVIEEVNLLLEDLEININAANENGMTPLMLGAANGHTEVVRTLLQFSGNNSLNIDDENGWTDVMSINVNAINKEGNTALMLASIKGHAKTIDALLEDPNLDVNVRNTDGITALMLAAANGYVAAVRSLANDARIDVNVATKSGRTALIWAADRGYAKIVRSLLRAPGIDITMATNHNVEALRWIARDWAFYRGYTEIIEDLDNPERCKALSYRALKYLYNRSIYYFNKSVN